MSLVDALSIVGRRETIERSLALVERFSSEADAVEGTPFSFRKLNKLTIIIPGPTESYEELITQNIEQGVAHITLLLGKEYIDVGPTFVESGTACYFCYFKRLLSNFQSTTIALTNNSVDLELANFVLAREVWALLSSQLLPLSINHVLRTNGQAVSMARHPILRIPNCICINREHLPPFDIWQPDR